MVDDGDMSRWTAIAKLVQEQGKKEDRGSPRFVARRLLCDPAGQVLDFSATGVRVIFVKNPKVEEGAEFKLTILSEDAERFADVRVAWMKKVGFRKWEAGLTFTDPEAAKKMALFRCGFDVLEDENWAA
jgi:hypothetical protein